ncbi:MAG TPA: hypothetical protein VGL83_21005 [Stellaceae bacterium]|jgi:hypothetical protein
MLLAQIANQREHAVQARRRAGEIAGRTVRQACCGMPVSLSGKPGREKPRVAALRKENRAR